MVLYHRCTKTHCTVCGVTPHFVPGPVLLSQCGTGTRARCRRPVARGAHGRGGGAHGHVPAPPPVRRSPWRPGSPVTWHRQHICPRWASSCRHGQGQQRDGARRAVRAAGPAGPDIAAEQGRVCAPGAAEAVGAALRARRRVGPPWAPLPRVLARASGRRRRVDAGARAEAAQGDQGLRQAVRPAAATPGAIWRWRNDAAGACSGAPSPVPCCCCAHPPLTRPCVGRTPRRRAPATARISRCCATRSDE